MILRGESGRDSFIKIFNFGVKRYMNKKGRSDIISKWHSVSSQNAVSLYRKKKKKIE
jgi:hypothetical protein